MLECSRVTSFVTSLGRIPWIARTLGCVLCAEPCYIPHFLACCLGEFFGPSFLQNINFWLSMPHLRQTVTVKSCEYLSRFAELESLELYDGRLSASSMHQSYILLNVRKNSVLTISVVLTTLWIVSCSLPWIPPPVNPSPLMNCTVLHFRSSVVLIVYTDMSQLVHWTTHRSIIQGKFVTQDKCGKTKAFICWQKVDIET